MSQISRLREDEISNGNLINADDLNSEFDQLVNESNDQDTRLDNLESGNITFSGVKSFNSAPKTDQVSEKTTDCGVTVDGVLLKDSTVNATASSEPGSPADGALWFNSTLSAFRIQLGGQTRTLSDPANYIAGPAVSFVSVSSVKIPSGFQCRGAANDFNMVFGSDVTVSIVASGANGLDTGSEASNTWYYLWAIGDSSGSNNPAGLLSISRTTPTLPAGYDKKRLLPIALRNNGSSDFIPFYVASGWPYRPFVIHDVSATYWNGSYNIGTNNVLSAGTATSFTSISLANFVPPISKLAYINWTASNASSGFSVRPAGTSHQGICIAVGSPQRDFIGSNSSQAIEYERLNGTSSLYIDAQGYVVTEV